MIFQHSAMELIINRKSTRTFDGRMLEPEIKEKFLSYLDALIKETNVNVRFSYVELSQSGEKKKLGTYGFISGARQYLVALIDREETDAVELGYIFEKAVLHALDLGIHTCWLGGTFKREEFGQEAEILDHEHIPIVTPLGYEQPKMRLMEVGLRKAVGAEKRKPWEKLFYNIDNKAPLTKEDAGDYEQVLEMVRKGPSASNKQPWRIAKEGSFYHLFLKRTKGYGVSGYDIQLNDIGIAKCHFELAAEELGLEGRWTKVDPAPVWDELEYVETWDAEKETASKG